MKNQKIREIHDAFDRKAFSAVELTETYLQAARADAHNAWITLCEDRARAQARAADKILVREGRVPRERYPLLGIPIGIKDNLTLEGVRTTCASRILENYFPPYTATGVQRLEEAGAVTLGKLNMDEFAMGGSNETSAFGPVVHPTHPGHVPGGSSGGSATAVRAGHCVAALGSDTGGSIRLPAHFCGIVGLKPTYGRISRSGLVAFASSLDQIGPMTCCVEDAALLLEVMGGVDPLDSTSSMAPREGFREAALREPDWKKLTLGVPKECRVEGVSADVTRVLDSSLRWMEGRGARVREISLPLIRYSVAIYYIVAVCEASSNLARYDGVRYGLRGAPAGGGEARDLESFYGATRALFGPEVKRRIILGTFALSSGYSEAYYRRACRVRGLLKRELDRALAEEVDLILGPVSPTTAFRLGEKMSDPLQMYLNDIFAIPANLAGLPAMSIPCGEDAQGLPIGLHLMAPAFGEAKLLSVARALESWRQNGEGQ